MTDEEILDAAASIIARRARETGRDFELTIRQDGTIDLWEYTDDNETRRARRHDAHAAMMAGMSLGKAWTKEEAR